MRFHLSEVLSSAREPAMPCADSAHPGGGLHWWTSRPNARDRLGDDAKVMQSMIVAVGEVALPSLGQSRPES
jgi:hypothetical protein